MAIFFLVLGLLNLSSGTFTEIMSDIKSRNSLSNLIIVATYVLWIEIWLFYLLVFQKKSKMFKFVNRLDKLINRDQRNDLKRLSKRMVVLIVSFILFSSLVLFPYTQSIDEWHGKLRKIAFGVFGRIDPQTASYGIMIPVVLFNSITHLLMSTPAFTLAIYVYFHRFVIHAFVNYFDQFLAKHSKRGGINNHESYASLKYLTKISSVFEQLFSFFPCLSLTTSLFLSSSYILLQLKEQEQGRTSAIGIILFQVARLLMPIILILMVSRNHDLLGAAAEKTVLVINQSDNRDNWLMKEIRRVCKWKATVFFMIDLDRSLIPAFCGALLSFSVLFLEISNDTCKDTKISESISIN